MSPREPAFLYFDLGNVLLPFSHQRMCEQIAAVFGTSAEAVRGALFSGDDPRLLAFETGRLSGDELYEALCAQLGSRPPIADVARAASDIFSLRGDIVPVVARLAEAGYRLGVLSNTSCWHWDWVTSRPYALIVDLFDHYALSYQTGALKPTPEAFAAAAEIAGVPAEEIFFTDDIIENVQGALAAGFDAVHFTNVTELVDELRARGIRWNF